MVRPSDAAEVKADVADSTPLNQGTTVRHLRRLGLGLGPALFLLLEFSCRERGWPLAAAHLASVAGLMAAWWLTEAVPIPVTSLVPLVLFPLLGISSGTETARQYADPIIFLFIGGFILAAAIQRSGLHRRLALGIVGRLGVEPRRLVLGFMLATALVAMWVSNTATAMLMLPIALAVILHLSDHGTRPEVTLQLGPPLLLGVAYASSIGGMGTVLGTPPNLILAGFLRRTTGLELGFLRWLEFGLPLIVVFLPAAWWILCRYAGEKPLGSLRLELRDAEGYLASAKAALGPMSPAERRVGLVFLATVLAWVTRQPIDLEVLILPGWSQLPGLEAAFLHDSTVAMTAAVALFLLPDGEGRRLLDWPTAVSAIPWGTVLLFGGGFALAAGFSSSGLADLLGAMLGQLTALPPWLIVLVVCVFMTFLTELTSNTATATMVLPVLAATEQGLGLPPSTLLLPATLSASCAFMLPVATPPNAIVFGSGLIPMGTMARVGLILNLVGVFLIGGLSLLRSTSW